MKWGKYSEESFYATMGRPAAAAGQPSGQAADSAGQQPAQSKKGRRRDAAAASKKQPQKTEEEDMAEAKRRLKVCHWQNSLIQHSVCSACYFQLASYPGKYTVWHLFYGQGHAPPLGVPIGSASFCGTRFVL